MAIERNAAVLHAIADRLAPTVRRQFLAAVRKLQSRMTLDAILRAIEQQGGLTVQLETAIAAWPDDLRPAVATINRVFAQMAEATETALARQLRLGPFTVTNPRAAAAADAHAARLVREVTAQTRQAIDTTIARATQGAAGSPRQVARTIREIVGLTERQAGAVMRFRVDLLEAGQSADAVARATARYAKRLQRQRALTIARTETIRASAAGRQATWEDAVAEGYLPPDAQKRWVVSQDDDTCPVCLAMEGELVGLTETFSGGVQEPPRHPNCRCTTVLVLPSRRRSAA